jgi:sialate O-acetylesterase
MIRKLPLLAAVLVGAACCCGPSRADVKPHALFSEGMVLQQGSKVPVWGTADDGEQVTVRCEGQEASATAKDGRWQVRLDNLKAGGPYELTIAGKNTVTIKNVLVGEVWVCSGQSNMEWPVRASADAERHIANSANPKIRLFTVPKVGAEKPLDSVKGQWKECGPDTVGSFSAVAYFFGRDVQKALDVPVGLIHTSWGGTPAEAWTRLGALEASPELKHYVEGQARARENFPKAMEKYKADLAKHEEAVKKAKDEGQQPPKAPAAPQNPLTGSHSPAALYNGMIAPLIPYALRGAIWYQGESNAGRAYEYRTLFPAMIQNWRADWKQGDFPFLFVQLAPFDPRRGSKPEVGESAWAELREAQLLTTRKLPNTAMAVITDVGDEKDIHPKQKEPVGARLALAAQALAFGRKLVYSGPEYDKMTVEGNKAVLSFRHAGGGLEAKGGPLVGFTVCGADHKFVKAEAEIRDDKVVVWSDQVAKPEAVRFGWADFPVVNLWNKDGLPASPFRTDDYAMITAPKKPASGAGAGGQ